jgi:hypothetical protein
MADTPERPIGSTEAVTSAPPAAFPGQAPPERDRDRSVTYRPLSLMAVAGFGLAALYALIVLIGAITAFFNHTPLLLGIWTLVVPLVGVVLCWAARANIRNSEDTLSGLAFTVWGVALSVLFGLSYLAYWGATYFAVRQQAASFAAQWIDKVKAGQLEQAFMGTLKPSEQTSDSDNLRDLIERRYNEIGGPSNRGQFTGFTQQEFVRLLQQGGDEAKVTYQDITSWDYDKGGFVVQMIYHVTMPLGVFDLQVTAHGSESRTNEYPGRRWRIVGESTHLVSGSVELMKEGDALRENGGAAIQFATKWAEKVTQHQVDAAYLDTLPPAERKAHQLLGAAMGGPLLAPDFLKGREAFTKGSLVNADRPRYWAPKNIETTVIGEVKEFFGPGGNRLSSLTVEKNVMPLFGRDGDKVRYEFEVLFRLVNPQQPPGYQANGRLYVVTDAKNVDGAKKVGGADVWRIERIELVRGNKITSAGGGGQARPPIGAPQPLNVLPLGGP